MESSMSQNNHAFIFPFFSAEVTFCLRKLDADSVPPFVQYVKTATANAAYPSVNAVYY